MTWHWSIRVESPKPHLTAEMLERSREKRLVFKVSRETLRPISVGAVVRGRPEIGDRVLFIDDPTSMATCYVRDVSHDATLTLVAHELLFRRTEPESM